MKKIITSAILFVAMLVSNIASAHTMWVNAYDSFTHMPGHIMTIIGFGHNIPLDDMLSSDFGNIGIEKYEIVNPEGVANSIGLPDTKRQKMEKTKWGATYESGDIGVRKIAMSKDSPKGTYMVSLASQPTFVTKYINKKGKTKFAMLPMDEIKDAKEVLDSMRYSGYAKSYVKFGQWTKPQRAGGDIEILPLADLGGVRAGDLIEFEVTLGGKKLTTDADNIVRVLADSNTFGSPDGYQLHSYVFDGKAKFRIPTAGQWVVHILVQRDIESTPELAYLKKKTKKVYLADSVTFVAKP